MNTTPNAPTKRRSSARFSALSWSALVWWAGACGNAENNPNDSMLGTIGSPSGTVSPVAVAPTTGPGSNAGTGAATGSGAVSGGNTGLNPTGAPSSNVTSGAATSGASTSGSATSAEPCVDVEPPPDPEWPDATCTTWATETEECGAAWFANYCDASCGRCTPQGGTIEPEPEPCVDVEPPADPEWPDATCATWATETEECDAAWFASYCDVSCGRCVPEGDTTAPVEPEPEKCEDILPPEDPEWPGATCAEWAAETEECGADWFASYCDVSCGRCVPEGGIPETPMGVDCSGEGLPNVTGGEGFATRYWDCCQTHCAQFNGHRCGQDGVSGSGDQRSSCEGGGSFACYDEAPRAVSDCLSYGHVAKSNPNCGGCYRIQFTGQGEHNASDPGSQLIAGKQMIVKVSNTGGDVAHNQFDLMIPGGGVGRFDACSRQWGATGGADYLGAQYGGFLTNCTGSHTAKKECVRQECMKIPAGSAREGCFWFVDWFEVADNPRFTSQPTDCPF